MLVFAVGKDQHGFSDKFLEDLQTAYEELLQNKAVQLPPRTTSFQKWVSRLIEYANSPAAQRDLTYWLTRSQTRVHPLPGDYPITKTPTISSSDSIITSLDRQQTETLLHVVPGTYHTQINDALLTALVWAFAQWADEDRLLVNLEGHGREDLFPDINLSRTVGWFTTLFPVLLDIHGCIGIGDALKMVKEQLRQIPSRGLSYGLLRYLASDRKIVEQL